jgi:hypothetical protein
MIMLKHSALLCAFALAACGNAGFDEARKFRAAVDSTQSKLLSRPVISKSPELAAAAKRVINEPARMCEGAITDTRNVVIPAVAKPPYLKYYKDPAFGSKVIRITNSGLDEVRKPPYSTMQAWNADESLILLYRTGGKVDGYHFLLDGHTYQPIKKLNIFPADLEEIFWSHTDPDKFYYVSTKYLDFAAFREYSVSTGKSKTIAKFSQLCGLDGVPTGGGDIHMQSFDDDLFGFRCESEDDVYKMFSYRISTGETVVQPIGEGTEWEQWTAPTPAPSGDRFWYQGVVLGTDLKTVERKLDLYKSGEHSNVGLTHDGQDALYQVAFNESPDGCQGDAGKGVGHLVEHNLETGDCRVIIGQAQGYPYTTSSTHISAQAYLRPGWVLNSSVGNSSQLDYFTNKLRAPAMFSEIYLTNTDPDNTEICRLAHHRSFGKSAENGDYLSYFGEPHATISPSGTRILFGSDWYDSGSVDSYVIELPGYKKPQ